MGRDIGLLPSTLWLQIAVLVCASVLIRSDPSPLLPLVWNRIYMHLPQLPHRISISGEGCFFFVGPGFGIIVGGVG